MSTLSLSDTLDAVARGMAAKAVLAAGRAWTLAMLAGAYIALAGFGSTVISANFLASPDTYGIGRCICGLIFPVGLIMVVIAGGELFTGNCLMTEAWRQKLITLPQMLRSWCLVYLGNLAGALLVTGMVYYSGIFSSGGGTLAAAIIRTGAAKAQLEPGQAFLLGIGCNWLVCLAVWMATRTNEASQKVLLLFLPIWLFVASGYEHSVANMYYLPAGWLAAHDQTLLHLSTLNSAIADKIAFYEIIRNLAFVTLGNIAGGSVFVGSAYAIGYAKKA